MNMEKADILIEALPYIKKFRGKVFVIKYGGSIMKDEEAKKAFIEDVVLLKLVGIQVVIVHGGGPSITKMVEKLGMKSSFVQGLRITDESMMEIVEMVLSGQINKEIAAHLCHQGINAIGISGRDGNLIEAQKIYLQQGEEQIDIGYVGEVTKINRDLLLDLLDKDLLPVISPIGRDGEGQVYNINADYVASAISSILEAEKLILLTDVKGIYKDIYRPESFISTISVKEVEGYITKGWIAGGMVPKAQCCVEAIEKGTKNVHLIDGRNKHSLLLEIFTDDGIGTMVKGGE